MGFDSVHEIGETLNPNQVVTLVAMLFSAILITLTLVGSQMAIQRRAQQKECADWGNWRRERNCQQTFSFAISMGYELHKPWWVLFRDSWVGCGGLHPVRTRTDAPSGLRSRPRTDNTNVVERRDPTTGDTTRVLVHRSCRPGRSRRSTSYALADA
jgi:hypothetical protein